MIKRTNLSPLRHREAYRVYSTIENMFCHAGSLPLALQPLFDRFATCLSAYDAALSPPSSGHLTKKLAECDRLRVYGLRSLFCYLKFLSSAPESDKAEAAAVLLRLIDKKACTRKPYGEKTAAIDRFLLLADVESNQKYIHLLDIASRLSHLRALNEQFRNIYTTRSALLSGITPGAARSARSATHAAFVKLCELLNALALVNGESDYKPLIDRINELLTEAREAVAHRLGHRKSGAANDKPVSPPDTPDIST